MVRKLTGHPLELDDVLPLVRHQYTFKSGLASGQTGDMLTKFKDLDVELFGQDRFDYISQEKILLADLIDPPILKAKGFNAYLRKISEEMAGSLPRHRIVPDLWFELTPVKENRLEVGGEVLGLIEIIDTNDINPK